MFASSFFHCYKETYILASKLVNTYIHVLDLLCMVWSHCLMQLAPRPLDSRYFFVDGNEHTNVQCNITSAQY